jgi:hypothetical protein
MANFYTPCISVFNEIIEIMKAFLFFYVLFDYIFSHLQECMDEITSITMPYTVVTATVFLIVMMIRVLIYKTI